MSFFNVFECNSYDNVHLFFTKLEFYLFYAQELQMSHQTKLHPSNPLSFNPYSEGQTAVLPPSLYL